MDKIFTRYYLQDFIDALMSTFDVYGSGEFSIWKAIPALFVLFALPPLVTTTACLIANLRLPHTHWSYAILLGFPVGFLNIWVVAYSLYLARVYAPLEGDWTVFVTWPLCVGAVTAAPVLLLVAQQPPIFSGKSRVD